jgi:hypothetical protein
MEDYLNEIEFAVTPVLQAVWHEHVELEKMNAELGPLFEKVYAEYESMQSVARHAMSTGNVLLSRQAWKNNSGDDLVLFQKNGDADALKRRIAARRFAVDALAGNLLQFAKQGISIVHGNLQNCPEGRYIGTQTLKSVIWCGRNQSLHWEEGSLSVKVMGCFRRLSIENGISRFGMFTAKNLGFEVVQLLGWRTFKDFSSDLLLFHS